MTDTIDFLYCFTVDTDSDSYFGNRLVEKNASDKSIIGWKNLEKGRYPLTETADRVLDSYGNRLPITWFIRCDAQVNAEFGDYAHLIKKHLRWWHDRVNLGDDLQWHAHLYIYENNTWIQNTHKYSIQKELSAAKKAFELCSLFPKVVRIGEAYHSNNLMSILEELGMKADSTAIPGRKRDDTEKSLDWRCTPNYPYHPSKNDYRIPGTPQLNVWEIPMNTVETKVSYDRNPLLRYVNPAFHPEVLYSGLKEFVKTANILVSIIHPFEVLPDFFEDDYLLSHLLLAFNPNAIDKNIGNLKDLIETSGRKIRFVTMNELISRLDKVNE